MAYDLVIRGGLVVDGTGSDGRVADVALAGDRIAVVGDVAADVESGDVIDATGLVVAPGFVNMLSHSYASLVSDPRGLSELLQGVTTQVFGEGHSMGPWTDAMRKDFLERASIAEIEAPWSRLSEYLAYIEKRGVSQNVCSYIGATTIRVNGVGYEDRPPTKTELDHMRALVAEEMADGALGIGSALIYPPGFFASTDELVELCRATAPYNGKYISHMRSEGNQLIEGIDELLEISRRAEVPAEVYHLKAAGQSNWPKMDIAIEKLEAARAAGEPITADVYTYTAGGTSLSACIPPSFHEGGAPALKARLADASLRAEMRAAIEGSNEGWENLYLGCGGGAGVLVLSVMNKELRHYQGNTLAEIAESRAQPEVEALLDLVAEGEGVGCAYFMMSEENLRNQLRLPWVAFGSDAAASAAEGRVLEFSGHPRAYGNFARVLGHYVRDEKVITMPEAIRRLTSLPVSNLGLDRRGQLREEWFADVVVFDADTITDRATYTEPHRYAEGVRHVIVNGRPAIRDGEFTGDLSGRALYGPGKR